MTVLALTVSSGPFVGNGATTVFPFTFSVGSSAELQVQVNSAVVTAGFTVTLNADQSSSPGGSITFTTPPLTGATIVIASDPSFQQLISFKDSGPFLQSTLDIALDRIARPLLYLRDRLLRSITVPVGMIVPTYEAFLATVKGDPGGGPGDIGLFLQAPLLNIAIGTDIVATSGYSSLDVGAAVYTYDAAVNAAYVMANPRTSFISLNGRGFRLSTEQDITLRMFGAKGDGTTDDTTAIQAALDYIKALGGGELRFTAGNYKITAGLSFDNSAETDRFTKRLRIIGDGRAHTQLKMFGVAGTLLNYTGSLTNAESYLDLNGIRLSGDNTIGSRGLYLNTAAFAGIDDVVVEGFDQNVEFLNVDQTLISNSNIRWGRKGLKTDLGTETAANSLILLNVAIGNNLVNGIDATDLNLFIMIGGSIQYNGATGGDATNFGAKLNDPGTSYGPIKFVGVTFEGNGGQADLWINSTTTIAAISVDSCGFMRSTVGDYAVNNIRLDGSQPTRMKLTATGFRSANGYVPNAGRPYIAINNTTAIVHSDATNVFGSATEAPSWYATPYPVLLNAGLTFIGGGLTGTVTYDPPSLAAGAKDTIHTMTVTGAALGDKVQASFSIDLAGARIAAWVSATNTVSYYAINENGANPLDLASGTLSVKAVKS